MTVAIGYRSIHDEVIWPQIQEAILFFLSCLNLAIYWVSKSKAVIAQENTIVNDSSTLSKMTPSSKRPVT